MYLYENDDYDFFARPRISDAVEFSIKYISHEVAENFVAAATSLFQFEQKILNLNWENFNCGWVDLVTPAKTHQLSPAATPIATYRMQQALYFDIS